MPQQRVDLTKQVQGPDWLWAFKLGTTSKHSPVVNTISLTIAIGSLQQHSAHIVTSSSLEYLAVHGKYTIKQWP